MEEHPSLCIYLEMELLWDFLMKNLIRHELRKYQLAVSCWEKAAMLSNNIGMSRFFFMMI